MGRHVAAFDICIHLVVLFAATILGLPMMEIGLTQGSNRNPARVSTLILRKHSHATPATDSTRVLVSSNHHYNSLENELPLKPFSERQPPLQQLLSPTRRKVKRSARWLLSEHIHHRQKLKNAQQRRNKTNPERPPQTLRNLFNKSTSFDGMQRARCWADRMVQRLALRVGKTWALQMADSSGHVSSGAMTQEMDFLGVRDECVSVQTPFTVKFQAQFCVGSLVLNETSFLQSITAHAFTGLSLHLCLPDSCDQTDVETVMHNHIQALALLLPPLDLQHVRCTSGEGIDGVGGAEAGVLTFLCLWAAVVIVCTVLDCVLSGRDPGLQRGSDETTRCENQERAQILADAQAEEERPRLSVHYSPRESEPGPSSGRSSGPSSEHASSSPERNNMVKIEFNIDSDLPTTSPPKLTTRSVPKQPQPPTPSSSSSSSAIQQGSRNIRGILRKKTKTTTKKDLNVSLIRAADSTRAEELGSLRRLLRCFSVEIHVKTLLDTSQSSSEIGCLHGIRVLSFLWLGIAVCSLHHAAYVRNTFPLFSHWRGHRLLYAFLGNSDLSMESLFAVSGLSVGYVYSTVLRRKEGRMNWLWYVGRRYWQVVPSMVVTGMTYLALFPHLASSSSSGPLAVQGQAPDLDPCLQYGWMNVLLVQNFAPEVCMGWSWFLAVDFQLFLLTPVLLLLLVHRRPRYAYMAVLLTVLGSWVVSGAVTHLHHLPITRYPLPRWDNASSDTHHHDNPHHRFLSTYFYQPWAHAGSFFPPFLLGWLLHTTRRRSGLSRRCKAAGWVVVTVASFSTLFGPGHEQAGGGEGSAGGGGVAVAYNAVHGTVWGLCVCWVVLACSTGQADLLNRLLSWSGWKPLSRLVLGAYLTFPVVLRVSSSSASLVGGHRQLPFATPLVMVYHWMAVLVSSCVLSAVLTVTVQLPCNALLSTFTRTTCFGAD